MSIVSQSNVCTLRAWVGWTLLTLAISASPLRGQETATKPRTFLGAKECLKCHTAGLPREPDPLLAAAGFGANLTDDSWVLLNEVTTWIKSDRHLQAFTSLKNERSQRMGELLGVKEIHRDKRCLACHTGFPLSAMGDDPHAAPENLLGDLRVAQGVSCEGCHSPSGDAAGTDGPKGWYVPHASKANWRFRSAKEKQEQFGFTNIRSPVTRARVCLSCHLGSVAAGRVVTHEMYAAGHPPLPGFELETFAQQMPKHWRDFDQKSDAVRDEFLKLSADDTYGRDSYKLDNLHQTQAMLVAALVAFSENLKLTRDLASEQSQSPVLKPDWPELSQFECFACHHDLKDKSWRQLRTPRGAPGRPAVRSWPTVLAKLAAQTSGEKSEEFDRRVEPLDQLLSHQPFGAPERWDEVVTPLTVWIDDRAATLERKPLTRDQGLPLLRQFLQVADSDYWDYDSARQLVWGMQVLRRELASDRSPPEVRERISSLDSDFAEIEAHFSLNLLDGLKAMQEVPGSTNRREVVEIDLTKSLPPIAKYDAVRFREQCRGVASKLAK
jgi:hypothetical protein